MNLPVPDLTVLDPIVLHCLVLHCTVLHCTVVDRDGIGCFLTRVRSFFSVIACPQLLTFHTGNYGNSIDSIFKEIAKGGGRGVLVGRDEVALL